MSKKQRLTDKTDEVVIHKLFPKKVVEEVKKVAHEKDNVQSHTKKDSTE